MLVVTLDTIIISHCNENKIQFAASVDSNASPTYNYI